MATKNRFNWQHNFGQYLQTGNTAMRQYTKNKDTGFGRLTGKKRFNENNAGAKEIKMSHSFVVLAACLCLILGCDSLENNDKAKIEMTLKMKQKVKTIGAELKVYCDSETYRTARLRADSILAKKKFK